MKDWCEFTYKMVVVGLVFAFAMYFVHTAVDKTTDCGLKVSKTGHDFSVEVTKDGSKSENANGSQPLTFRQIN